MPKLIVFIIFILNITLAIDATSMPRTSSDDSSHSDTDDQKDAAAKKIQKLWRKNNSLAHVKKENSRAGMRNMPEQEEAYLTQLKLNNYPSDKNILDWLAHEGFISTKFYQQGQDPKKSNLKIKSVAGIGNSSDGVIIVHACENANNPSVSDPSLPGLCKDVYVLKIMSPKSVRENLELQKVENDLLSKINSLDPKMPKIIYAERMGYYLTATNKKIYFQLIHAAQGYTIGEIIQHFLKDPHINKQILTEAFRALGHQIGYLHNNFLQIEPNGQLKTIIHGDLHPWNIFYDDVTRKISLIDNNRAHIDSPKVDIAGFIIFTCFKNLMLFENNGQYLMRYALNPMIDAYLSEFKDESSQNMIKISVYTFLNQVVDIYNHSISPLLKLNPSGIELFQNLITTILENKLSKTDMTRRVNDLSHLIHPQK